MDQTTLLAMASVFTVIERNDADGVHSTITVERRRQEDGSVKWAVYKDGSVLHKATRNWIYDYMNSSRTDEHIAETRWDTLGDALEAAQAEADLMRSEGPRGYAKILMARFEKKPAD